jgi:hypothetical protein
VFWVLEYLCYVWLVSSLSFLCLCAFLFIGFSWARWWHFIVLKHLSLYTNFTCAKIYVQFVLKFGDAALWRGIFVALFYLYRFTSVGGFRLVSEEIPLYSEEYLLLCFTHIVSRVLEVSALKARRYRFIARNICCVVMHTMHILFRDCWRFPPFKRWVTALWRGIFVVILFRDCWRFPLCKRGVTAW